MVGPAAGRQMASGEEKLVFVLRGLSIIFAGKISIHWHLPAAGRQMASGEEKLNMIDITALKQKILKQY